MQEGKDRRWAEERHIFSDLPLKGLSLVTDAGNSSMSSIKAVGYQCLDTIVLWNSRAVNSSPVSQIPKSLFQNAAEGKEGIEV